MKARRNPLRVTAVWLVVAAFVLLGVIGAVRYFEHANVPATSPAAPAGQEASPEGAAGPSQSGTARSLGEDDGGDPPALEMQGVEVVGRSRGATQWRLTGARVSQTEEGAGVVQFDDVQRATFYRGDGSTFQLSADAGSWDTSENDLELWGDVALTWRDLTAPTGSEGGGGPPTEPRMWTQGLQRLRLQASEGSLQLIGPFQLVWKVGDGV